FALAGDDPHLQPEGSSRLMTPSKDPTGTIRRREARGAVRRASAHTLGQMLTVLRAGAVALAAMAAVAAPAAAELRLDITRGQVEPMPIAIVPFAAETGNEGGVGRDLADVVTSDLEGSGLFAPVNPRAFIQTPESLAAGPRFGDWRAVNAQALVHGGVTRQPDGRLRVEFRLWDVYGEQQMAGFAYHTQPQNWRRVAHIIADAIYKRITGEQGYFDTRIVYVAESGPAQRRLKPLATMDPDRGDQAHFADR